MNCREALEKLYDYLDSEIGSDERKHLDQHLESCTDCLRRYQLEEQFNKVIKERLQNQPDISALKDKIKREIDKMDDGVQPRNMLFFVAPLLVASVAALLILFPSGKATDSEVIAQVVAPFAAEYGKCLQKLTNFTVQSHDPGVVHAEISRSTDLPDELFQFSSPDVMITGAAIAGFPQGDQPLVDFQAFGEDVIVFVLDRNQIDVTPFRRVDRSGKTMYVGSCRYYYYAIWNCEGKQCVAVSKLSEDKLIEFSILF